MVCQEAAISPRAIPALTMPAKVARLSASTSANAGSTPVSEDRAARDSATKPVAPARRADAASRPRTASGYSRSMTTTTGMATSTGVRVRYRSIPPPAGRPWSCSTTRPATEAAHAVISATGRRHARAGRPVSALVIRAGLLAGAGLRCCHAAISGGPASAAATAIPASGQPAEDDPAPPGIKAMARPAPITAAGPVAITAARTITAATCRSDPPRARSMVSSTSRRATIILAASRMTAAPTTIRLTNSSSSTVWMAAWVPRNSDRSEISGEVTVSVSALGASVPVSAGVVRDRAVERVVQALRLVRVHPAGVEREFPVQLHAGPAERVLHRGELVRVREDAAHPERHARRP